MYVCVCPAVTARQIHSAARDGARSLKDLRRELGVTKDCGLCAACANQCLKDARRECGDHDTPRPVALAAW